MSGTVAGMENTDRSVWRVLVLAVLFAAVAIVGVYFAQNPIEVVSPSADAPAQELIENGHGVSAMAFVPGGSVDVDYTADAYAGGGCTAYYFTNGHQTDSGAWTHEVLPDGQEISCPLAS